MEEIYLRHRGKDNRPRKLQRKQDYLFGHCKMLQLQPSFWQSRMESSYCPGGTQLFSGRYVRPRFQNLGACERINCNESGGLWADFHWKRGLSNWYCAKFSSVLMKIAVKLELQELKIVYFLPNFCFWRGNVSFLFQMRGLWMDLCLNWGSCERKERRGKGGFEGRTSPYPYFRWVSPPRVIVLHHFWAKLPLLYNYCMITLLSVGYDFTPEKQHSSETKTSRGTINPLSAKQQNGPKRAVFHFKLPWARQRNEGNEERENTEVKVWDEKQTNK